jgi:D-psicose/D-tagatose/L-ribulose 3-epimerase
MLTVSNISWHDGGDPNFLNLVARAQFDGIDIAPTKIWPNWNVPADKGESFRRQLEDRGLLAVGMQSLFFGVGPLNLFCKGQLEWLKFLDHVNRLISIANATGAKCLVFGAPTNRDPLDLTDQGVEELALERLSQVGDSMVRAGLILCLEPVPRILGGKFLCTTDETANFLTILNHSGVQLNVDSAVLFHDNVDIRSTILRYAPLIAHVHVSEPGLSNFSHPSVNHALISATLREIGYSGAIAIEMNAKSGAEFANLVQATEFVKSVYG